MIENYEFGKFKINGLIYESNVKIINGQIITYKHLQDHKLTLGDLTDLINTKPSYLIIGTGAYGVIKVKDEIINFIKSQKIIPIIEKTGDACKKYNKLIQDHKKVVAFLHNTC